MKNFSYTYKIPQMTGTTYERPEIISRTYRSHVEETTFPSIDRYRTVRSETVRIEPRVHAVCSTQHRWKAKQLEPKPTPLRLFRKAVKKTLLRRQFKFCNRLATCWMRLRIESSVANSWAKTRTSVSQVRVARRRPPNSACNTADTCKMISIRRTNVERCFLRFPMSCV
jgi:hypothetical protein